MKLFKVALVLLASWGFVSAGYAETNAGNRTSNSTDNNVRIRYNKPATAELSGIASQLKANSVISDVIALINEQFSLPEPLAIVFGAADGPLYDYDANEILIPYTFLEQVANRFKAADYANPDISIAEATNDALVHTLFHELAHALIAIHQLPVVGKEEDAADSLAAVLSIEYFSNGAEIAISAADLFYLESSDIEEFEEADFWDEHSLDLQRYYATLCHVYGSDPKKYAYLLEDTGFSQERADFCINEYDSAVTNWLALLAPYMVTASESVEPEIVAPTIK